jgi:mono/diheme cytochrome c family protein
MKPLVMILLLIAYAGFGLAESQAPEQSIEEKAMFIFRMNCIQCHGSKKPPKQMRLDGPDMLAQTVIDVHSKEREHLKRIDTAEPDKSYLLMKIKGDRGIAGDAMPPDYPLNANELKVIREYLYSLAGKPVPAASPSTAPLRTRRPVSHFNASKLVNLATTRTLKKKEVSFLIAHRFYPDVGSGFDSMWGLDGPSTILFALGYGFSDSLEMVLSRSNLNKEIELSFGWKILDSRKNRLLPLDAVLHLGNSLVTRDIPDRKTFDSRHIKVNAQLSLSFALNRRISLLLVPSFSSKTNHWEEDPESTFSLGMGARYHFGRGYSLMAEWIPVVSGYKDTSNAWGFGMEKKLGKHVFQLFIVNSVGLTTDQYITGGDLKLEDSDFRIGFNIFRRF